MNDIDELHRQLHHRAAAADVGHTPVHVITRRGARRRARRRTLATAGVLAVGTLGSITAIELLSKGDTPARITSDPIDTEAPEPTTASTAPTEPPGSTTTSPLGTQPDADPDAAMHFVDSPLVWNPVTVGSAEAVAGWDMTGAGGINSGGSGPFFRLSTEPGRGATSGTRMYRSDDGIHWEAGAVRDETDPFLPLASTGDRIYSMATQAASARTPDDPDVQVFAATSTDGGASWDATQLPYDLAPLRANPGVSSAGVVGRAAASNGSSIVMTGVVRASVTPTSLAPLLGLDPMSLGSTGDGAGFVQYETTPVTCAELDTAYAEARTPAEGEAPSGYPVAPGTRSGDVCVLWGREVARYTWADFGLGEEAQDAMRGIPVVFTSTDGTSYSISEAPALPDGFASWNTSLAAGDDGYLLAITGSVGFQDGPGTTLLFSSTDETNWQQLPELPTALNCGPITLAYMNGIPTVRSADCESSFATLVLTLRGSAWEALSIPTLVAPDAASGRLSTSVGAQGIVVAVQVGESVEAVQDETSVGPDAQGAGVATTVVGPQVDPATLHWVILYSPDGVSWSRQELADLVDGTDMVVSGVQITDTNVLVSVRPPIGSADSPEPLPDTTVLVGTLA